MIQQLMKLLGVSTQEQVQSEVASSCIESIYCPDGEDSYCHTKVCDTLYVCC